MMVLAHEAQNRIREIGQSKACRVLAHNDTGSGFSVFGGQMKEILLSKGYVTVVDDEDYAELTQHKWCVINDAPPRMYAMRAERMPKWYTSVSSNAPSHYAGAEGPVCRSYQW